MFGFVFIMQFVLSLPVSSLSLIVTKENLSGIPNLEVWRNEKVAEFVQKKHQDW